MTILKSFRGDILLLLSILVIGQIVFAFISSSFTAPRYEGRIYATTGVRHQQEDLHKLNEAAHYFGQTIIGWLKFPHFLENLEKEVSLPAGTSVSAHIQERQNIIFTVSAPSPLERETLTLVKDFIQKKLDDYNSVNQTEFVLSNTDYELVKIQRTYAFGAGVALLAGLLVSAAVLFIRREFSRD